MSWIQNIRTKWQAFRTWQIGDCSEAAGAGNKRLGKAFFRGTINSALPFFSGETLNTLLHLVFRPGYMIREFLRGKDNHILSPMTALIVFFAMQVVLSSMMVTDVFQVDEEMYKNMLENINTGDDPSQVSWNKQYSQQIAHELYRIYRITHLDQFPTDVHTRSQQMLAGLEGWMRGQGIFTFIWQILLVTCSLWLVGHRRYHLTFSASACIAAYMLCQYCFYNTLLMLFSLGKFVTIPLWLVLIFLYVNIYQLLGIGHKKTLRYVTLLTVVMLLLFAVYVTLITSAISLYVYGQVV